MALEGTIIKLNTQTLTCNLDVKLQTVDGEKLDISGEVRGFIPLRNRRQGLVTHIGEGMTRWQCGDQVGYGLAEYLRQVDPGA